MLLFLELMDLKVAVEMMDLAQTGVGEVEEADREGAGVAIVESVGLVLVGQPNVYLKTLLKIGIAFGQIKAPFQLPQPD